MGTLVPPLHLPPLKRFCGDYFYMAVKLVTGPEVEDGGEDASPGTDPGPPVNSGTHAQGRLKNGGAKGYLLI